MRFTKPPRGFGDDDWIRVSDVENYILEHKDCRHPHAIKDGRKGYAFVSCLIIILAKVKKQKPYAVAEDLGVLK